MAKFINDDAMDAALSYIAENGDELHLLSAEPSTYADIATYTLGKATLTTGVGGGDYDLEDGVVSGRRLTLVAKSVTGTDDGVATHAAIIDTLNSKILHFTVAPSYVMTVGVPQMTPSFDVWEIHDPT